MDFHIMGGDKLFSASLPEPDFSLLFSDHFVFPVSVNLLLN